MKITLIVGARPNFIKIAPIIHAIERSGKARQQISYRLVHTGQHYNRRMSATFFKQLHIPEPHANLGCGAGTPADQTAAIMIAFEQELIKNPTDLVLVVGDVTSTLACSITAKKLGIRVAHVEAGIRSGDLSMPEEINRMVTDAITDYFFTTTPKAGQNLLRLGVPEERIYWVGNVMIDTLLENRERLTKPDFWDREGLEQQSYFVLTLHRPANVDDKVKLKNFVDEIAQHAADKKVVFPIHPRTRQIFRKAGIDLSNLLVVEPMGYLEFNYLVKNSVGVLTDSGGITEETTVMGIPCITLSDTTARPETVTMGTNELVGTDPSNIGPAMDRILKGNWKKGSLPEKWDGKAAERIVETLMAL